MQHSQVSRDGKTTASGVFGVAALTIALFAALLAGMVSASPTVGAATVSAALVAPASHSSTPSGYRLVAADGGIFAFDAPFLGSPA